MRNPGTVFFPKRGIWYHRLFEKLLFWMPKNRYMGRFWTTVGMTIAHPAGLGDHWWTLAHEGRHVEQPVDVFRNRTVGNILHSVFYLFPQILAPVVAVVFCLCMGPWWALLGLVCLLPWPSPYRAWAELDAYKITVMVHQWKYGEVNNGFIDSYTSNFCDSTYWFMWPFRRFVKVRLRSAAADAREWKTVREVAKDSYIDSVYDLMLGNGMIAPGAVRAA